MDLRDVLVPLCFMLAYLSVATFTNSAASKNTSKDKNNSAAITALGHKLFFEKRLSLNGIKSCASCHAPEFAFTDGYRRSLGTGADLLQRNTPSLLNLSSYKTFNWANPELTNIEDQLLHPLFNTNPPELGMINNSKTILLQLQNDTAYKNTLANAGIKELNWDDVVKSLACYVRSLNARNSKYDLYLKGAMQLDEDEEKGKTLFFSKQLNCAACHSGTDFNEPADPALGYFFNTGLYNTGVDNSYADNDNGIANITKKSSDVGKFRIPSLRNISITAPYFHDGSASSLEEVIDIYGNGGRLINEGPYKGDGSRHPNKSGLIHPFSITLKEKKQLISFLYTFTDTTYMGNPLFTNPYKY